jgi:hypothetical protein
VLTPQDDEQISLTLTTPARLTDHYSNVRQTLASVALRLSTKEPEDQTQYDANEQGGSDWQIEAKVLSLNDNISRQSAESQLGYEGPKKPCGDQYQTKDDKRS